MTISAVDAPIVVGIDGSKAALRAAVWAADEAIDRDSVLRLLHVVEPQRGDQEEAMAQARRILAKAAETVASAFDQVKVETEIVHGDPAAELVNASHHARMVCVGFKGRRRSARHRRHEGEIAHEVVKSAVCTAVVVRCRKQPSPYSFEWVIAVLDEKPQSHVVLQTAINEALLRKAALLALTSWSTTKRARRGRPSTDLRTKLESYLDGDDLQVCAIPTPDHIFNVLEQSASMDQLVVIGTSNPKLAGELFSRRAAKILRKSDCSLMIARDPKVG